MTFPHVPINRYPTIMDTTRKKTIMKVLGTVTAIGIVSYWTAVFSGIFPVTETVPGYTDWFLSFPLADAWIAVCAFMAARNLHRDEVRAAVYGLLSASSLIFLGLYALLYGIRTGLLFHLTADEVVEILIKAYCLIVGGVSIRYYSGLLSSRTTSS